MMELDAVSGKPVQIRRQVGKALVHAADRFIAKVIGREQQDIQAAASRCCRMASNPGR
jgi:hypothetical protein